MKNRDIDRALRFQVEHYIYETMRRFTGEVNEITTYFEENLCDFSDGTEVLSVDRDLWPELADQQLLECGSSVLPGLYDKHGSFSAVIENLACAQVVSESTNRAREVLSKVQELAEKTLNGSKVKLDVVRIQFGDSHLLDHFPPVSVSDIEGGTFEKYRNIDGESNYNLYRLRVKHLEVTISFCVWGNVLGEKNGK